ncbi:hypothetical protein QMT40_001768 [Parvibaculaceae bacterium PLY_AMNH_Bact1]|nr:hypothetical protein QMT40_001768 [Parvibaculaceae bacterium PLY_AMNH_Bact1]
MSEALAREVAELSTTVKGMITQNSRDHERVRETLDKLTDEVKEAGKLAAANNQIMKQNTETNDDQETRIRSLEKWRWVQVGGMTSIGAIAGTLFNWWKGGGS